MKKLFLCISSQGYWGKSENIIESMVNAKIGNDIDTKFNMYLVSTDKPENVGFTNTGSMTYNDGDVITNLNDEFLNVSPLYTKNSACQFLLRELEKENKMGVKFVERLADYMEDCY